MDLFNTQERFYSSQHGEELFVERIIFLLENKYDGANTADWNGVKYRRYHRYVDIGCAYPIYANNTYFFYVHGDHGLVVEGNSEIVKHIQLMRPKDICVHACVSNIVGETTLVENAILGTVLGDEYDQKESSRREVVRTITINKLIEDNPDFSLVDLCSIDIDSAEEIALQQCDFSIFKPTILLIENFIRGIDQTPQWEKYLTPFYTYIGNSGCNGLYLRNEWCHSYFSWEHNLKPVL